MLPVLRDIRCSMIQDFDCELSVRRSTACQSLVDLQRIVLDDSNTRIDEYGRGSVVGSGLLWFCCGITRCWGLVCCGMWDAGSKISSEGAVLLFQGAGRFCSLFSVI